MAFASGATAEPLVMMVVGSAFLAATLALPTGRVSHSALSVLAAAYMVIMGLIASARHVEEYEWEC